MSVHQFNCNSYLTVTSSVYIYLTCNKLYTNCILLLQSYANYVYKLYAFGNCHKLIILTGHNTLTVLLEYINLNHNMKQIFGRSSLSLASNYTLYLSHSLFGIPNRTSLDFAFVVAAIS